MMRVITKIVRSDSSTICAITVALVLLVAGGIHAWPYLLRVGVVWGLVPAHSPLLRAAWQAYRTRHRDIVQYNPACTTYHPTLTYTLFPHVVCHFANFEFTTIMTADAEGWRNPRAKLAPRIAVLGDSHAMGWGVADTATVAEQLEQRTGTEVRNYGMSSYGTARELRAFALYGKHEPYVLIQYCDNDLGENQAFVATGTFDIMPQAQFQALVQAFQQRPLGFWYHFSFGLAILAQVMDRTDIPLHQAPWLDVQGQSFGAHVASFVHTLEKFSDVLQGTQVIVWYSNVHGRPFTDFPERLTQYLAQHPLPFPVIASHVNERLDASAYFVFDGHLNAAGHARIAQHLAQDLAQRGLGR